MSRLHYKGCEKYNAACEIPPRAAECTCEQIRASGAAQREGYEMSAAENPVAAHDETWSVAECGCCVVRTEDMSDVATRLQPKIAAQIVAEHNAHAALVAALKECKGWHQGDKWREGTPSERKIWNEHRDTIDAALALAGVTT